MENRKKVFVGLSGGVDSSVAALLLKKDGYDVVGVHLRCWNKGGCDVPEAEDARRVADKLEIPFYVLDMEKEYKKRVVDYMIEGYKNGITPNPDVACNREIKFGLFLEKALSMGADVVATGHYAKIKEEKGKYRIYAAKDSSKDQSYFLWALSQDQLKYAMFPIGGLLKTEVRKIAEEAGLPTAGKKDSQGICFIGEVSVKDFLEEYLPKRRGNARTTSGEILGTHEGAHFFTVGQRHGIGISGNEPYYVASKDVKTNTVTLASKDDPIAQRYDIEVIDSNIMSKTLPKETFVRVRYRQPLQKAHVEVSKNTAKITFEKPQSFIAPGQSAVIYSGDGKLIGGGVIV